MSQPDYNVIRYLNFANILFSEVATAGSSVAFHEPFLALNGRQMAHSRSLQVSLTNTLSGNLLEMCDKEYKK
jgi:hypothetical protein